MSYEDSLRTVHRNGRDAHIDLTRPIYGCPLCKAQAMQFYAVDGHGDKQRTDSFICRACGSSWQM
jgi:DNA-directed RNA polymerase subunit M/transcription elongation factor TFIIS